MITQPESGLTTAQYNKILNHEYDTVTYKVEAYRPNWSPQKRTDTPVFTANDFPIQYNQIGDYVYAVTQIHTGAKLFRFHLPSETWETLTAPFTTAFGDLTSACVISASTTDVNSLATIQAFRINSAKTIGVKTSTDGGLTWSSETTQYDLNTICHMDRVGIYPLDPKTYEYKKISPDGMAIIQDTHSKTWSHFVLFSGSDYYVVPENYFYPIENAFFYTKTQRWPNSYVVAQSEIPGLFSQEPDTFLGKGEGYFEQTKSVHIYGSSFNSAIEAFHGFFVADQVNCSINSSDILQMHYVPWEVVPMQYNMLFTRIGLVSTLKYQKFETHEIKTSEVVFVHTIEKTFTLNDTRRLPDRCEMPVVYPVDRPQAFCFARTSAKVFAFGLDGDVYDDINDIYYKNVDFAKIDITNRVMNVSLSHQDMMVATLEVANNDNFFDNHSVLSGQWRFTLKAVYDNSEEVALGDFVVDEISKDAVNINESMLRISARDVVGFLAQERKSTDQRVVGDTEPFLRLQTTYPEKVVANVGNLKANNTRYTIYEFLNSKRNFGFDPVTHRTSMILRLGPVWAAFIGSVNNMALITKSNVIGIGPCQFHSTITTDIPQLNSRLSMLRFAKTMYARVQFSVINASLSSKNSAYYVLKVDNNIPVNGKYYMSTCPAISGGVGVAFYSNSSQSHNLTGGTLQSFWASSGLFDARIVIIKNSMGNSDATQPVTQMVTLGGAKAKTLLEEGVKQDTLKTTVIKGMGPLKANQLSISMNYNITIPNTGFNLRRYEVSIPVPASASVDFIILERQITSSHTADIYFMVMTAATGTYNNRVAVLEGYIYAVLKNGKTVPIRGAYGVFNNDNIYNTSTLVAVQIPYDLRSKISRLVVGLFAQNMSVTVGTATSSVYGTYPTYTLRTASNATVQIRLVERREREDLVLNNDPVTELHGTPFFSAVLSNSQPSATFNSITIVPFVKKQEEINQVHQLARDVNASRVLVYHSNNTVYYRNSTSSLGSADYRPYDPTGVFFSSRIIGGMRRVGDIDPIFPSGGGYVHLNKVSINYSHTDTSIEAIPQEFALMPQANTVDIGESPIAAVGRLYSGYPILITTRFNGELLLKRKLAIQNNTNTPSVYTISENIVFKEEKGESPTSAITHIRAVGAYTESEYLDSELIKLYGHKFSELSVPYVNNQSTAHLIARASLYRSIEETVTLSVNAIECPFVEPGDCVTYKGVDWILVSKQLEFQSGVLVSKLNMVKAYKQ